MLTNREHDLLVALERLCSTVPLLPVDWKADGAQEESAKVRVAISHAQNLIKQIKPA